VEEEYSLALAREEDTLVEGSQRGQDGEDGQSLHAMDDRLDEVEDRSQALEAVHNPDVVEADILPVHMALAGQRTVLVVVEVLVSQDLEGI
jgi:hypothetical protein